MSRWPLPSCKSVSSRHLPPPPRKRDACRFGSTSFRHTRLRIRPESLERPRRDSYICTSFFENLHQCRRETWLTAVQDAEPARQHAGLSKRFVTAGKHTNIRQQHSYVTQAEAQAEAEAEAQTALAVSDANPAVCVSGAKSPPAEIPQSGPCRSPRPCCTWTHSVRCPARAVPRVVARPVSPIGGVGGVVRSMLARKPPTWGRITRVESTAVRLQGSICACTHEWLGPSRCLVAGLIRRKKRRARKWSMRNGHNHGVARKLSRI